MRDAGWEAEMRSFVRLYVCPTGSDDRIRNLYSRESNKSYQVTHRKSPISSFPETS
jgi:hypothetical protein